MKRNIIISLASLLVFGSGLYWLKWTQDEPRRESIKALQNFENSLSSGDSARLLASVVLPQAMAGRTAAEQVQFLSKALQDEISPEGIQALAKRGRFGRLNEVFPNEADRWAGQAGAPVTNCFAFRMDQSAIRAEVVLLKEGGKLRIVRCNNVTQVGWRGSGG